MASIDNNEVKYDDGYWHLQAAVDAGQPEDNALTHIACVVYWAIARDGFRQHDMEDAGESACVADIKARQVLPTVLLDQYMDLKLWSKDFTDQVAEFLNGYIDSYYPSDYEALFGKGLYHVPNTWGTYDKAAAALDARFAQWQADGRFSKHLPGAEPSRKRFGLFGR